jgi:excisionase family DNA binding protein
MKELPYDPLLTNTDAAKYLAIHPRELRRMAILREIACVRRGPLGHMKFRLSELNRWADQHTTRAKRAS